MNYWRLDVADGGPSTLRNQGGQRYCAKSAIDAQRRSIVFIVSDAVSNAWHREIGELVSHWGRHSVVVLLQMLEPRLWPRTQIGMPSALTSCYRPGTTNGLLKVDTEFPAFDDLNCRSVVPLPVASLSSPSLHRWAEMVSGGGGKCPSYLIPFDEARSQVPEEVSLSGVPDAGSPDAKKIVEKFVRSVSRESAQLAAYLAAVSPTPAIARTVQRALLPNTGPTELAEVFLGGLIRRRHPEDLQSNPEHAQYDFVEGTAEILRSKLRYSAEETVTEVVSSYLARRYGVSITTVTAIVEDPAGDSNIDPTLRSFAEYRRASSAALTDRDMLLSHQTSARGYLIRLGRLRHPSENLLCAV